jgi:hypothetical protein
VTLLFTIEKKFDSDYTRALLMYLLKHKGWRTCLCRQAG